MKAWKRAVKMFKEDGGDCTYKDSISLEKALLEIENRPINKSNFVGFVKGPDEIIQFVRLKENTWLMGSPIIETGEYTGSKKNFPLSTKEVKRIVENFIIDIHK